MKKTLLEKIRKDFESMDMSRYHILTYDELLKVNGGSGNDSDDSDNEAVGSESEESSDEGVETATESTTGEEGAGEPSADPTSESTSSGTSSESESGGHEIENTVEAVANAEVGDTLTRDDGTQVTITEGDITWAQEHCDSYGKNEEAADSKEAAENAGSATENASESQQVDNSNEAVANAQPGDTITRSDGTEVVLTQEDIDWAKDHIDGKSGKADSSKEGETSKGNNSAESRTTNSGAKENDTEYVEKQEASRAKAEEQLAARKNDELNNSPKGGNSLKTAIDENLKDPATLVGFTSDLAKEAAKNGTKSDLAAMASSTPLMSYSNALSYLGTAMVLYDVAGTTSKEIQSVLDGKESAAHAAYNAITHGVSVGAGSAFGTAVTTAATASTFGLASVPGLAAGIVGGASAYKACEIFFDFVEEQIW